MIPYYRRNLYVLALTSFLAGVSWNQVIPFLPLYLSELGTTPETVTFWSGLVFSMHFASALIMMPIWGRLSDRYGRKPMAVRAGVSLSLIYLLMSLVQAPWQLAVCRFLNGALTGFIPMSTALLASNTPKQYAGRYMAGIQTAVAAGNMLGPALGATMAGLFGIRGAMRLSAAAVFVSAMLVALLVEERNKPHGITERSTLIDDMRLAWQSPTLWVVLFINIVATIGMVGIQPILALHVEDLVTRNPNAWYAGMRESLIAVVFMLPAIAVVMTAARWVRMSENRGVYRVVFLSLIGSGLSCMLLGLTGNIFVFMVLFFVNGLFIAALRPVAAAIIATQVDKKFHGRAFGMQTSAQTLGGLVGPLTSGVIAGYFGNHMVFVLVGAVLILSLFVMRKHLIQETQAVQKGV